MDEINLGNRKKTQQLKSSALLINRSRIKKRLSTIIAPGLETPSKAPLKAKPAAVIPEEAQKSQNGSQEQDSADLVVLQRSHSGAGFSNSGKKDEEDDFSLRPFRLSNTYGGGDLGPGRLSYGSAPWGAQQGFVFRSNRTEGERVVFGSNLLKTINNNASKASKRYFCEFEEEGFYG